MSILSTQNFKLLLYKDLIGKALRYYVPDIMHDCKHYAVYTFKSLFKSLK